MGKILLQALVANKDTPILQCHGEADPMVNFDYGRLTAQALRALTSKHVFKSYPGMGHSSCQEVIIILTLLLNEKYRSYLQS